MFITSSGLVHDDMLGPQLAWALLLIYFTLINRKLNTE